MIRFQCKSDLVLWVDKHVARRAIKRALWTGNVKLLGGFHKIPPSNFPGWIIKVQSKNTPSVWNIAVVQNPINGSLRLSEISVVPWIEYAGAGHKAASLMGGDAPMVSLFMKDRAEMRIENESKSSEDSLSQG